MGSWATFNPDGIEQYDGTKLKERALKRTVNEVGNNVWSVDGNKRLRDAYPSYRVMLLKNGKYECECYSHSRGETRRRRLCSHVLGVMLFREGVVERDGGVRDEGPAVNEHWESEPSEPDQVVQQDIVVEPARGGGGRRRRRVREDVEPKKYLSVGAGTLPDEPLATDDRALGLPPLPAKFSEFRVNQWEAISRILEHFQSGKKIVMLSAPTGAGKSLVGEVVRRLMPGRAVYCCTTKSLQDQILGDFPYARVIKGRSNYPTETRADLTAEDCTGTQSNEYECSWCTDSKNSCPYQMAKREAGVCAMPILNIAYYLAETSAQDRSLFRNRQLVIIDEADTLESQLLSYIEVVVGSRLRSSIGVDTVPKKTVPNDWVRWLQDEIVPAVKARQKVLRHQARTLFGTDVEKLRQVKKLTSLVDRIRPLVTTSKDGSAALEDGWVMTGYEGSKDRDATVRFKPVRVSEYAQDILWSSGKQFLLMSATFVSPAQTAENLGLGDDEWAVVEMPSTFPVENRPVFIEGVAPMTNKTKEMAWPKMVEGIDNIVAQNPNARILIHTVSYQLTNYIFERSNSGRMMRYRNAQERGSVLEEFLSVDDAVLLAPSFDRGIDLPQDDCQVIIIAKLPYPYIGDKQVAARLYKKGGQTWYAVETIRSIVQMTGRAMRSHDDTCDSFILDSTFKRLYRENKRLFPKWWTSALVLSKTDPKYRPLIAAARERRVKRGQEKNVASS